MFNTNSYIAENWSGGYKLELELTSESDIDNWMLDFELPYNISTAYGAEIVKNDNSDRYTVSGLDGQTSLSQGQSIELTLIVEDNGQEALVPEFTDLDSISGDDDQSNESDADTDDNNETSEDELTVDADSESDTDTDDNDETSEDDSNTDIASEAESGEPTADVDSESDTDTDDNDETSEDDSNTDITSETESGEATIDVDNDFGGDLQSAIAAANDGEVVLLGSNVYNTSGITLDKDITIDGQADSVIDGGGTSGSILNITPGATGATIKDVEITNGNNGIYGDGASNLTLQNLKVNNVGLSQTIRDGQNNGGITLLHADGLQLLDSEVNDIGRKGVGILDTDGATVSGLTVADINLQAEHAQSHDAAGIKFFNTNNVSLKDSYFSRINAMHIWNDTTNGTVIENNQVDNVGSNFLAPSFNNDVDIHGIYNEKSVNSTVRNNTATSAGEFSAFNVTEFSAETMTLEGNNFSSSETNTQDYWVNESAEKLVATTENPYEADFNLFADDYFGQVNIG